MLRSFLRQRDALLAQLHASEEVRFNAPAWWIEVVRAAQPEHWQAVLRSGQQAPALVLRVNRRRADPETYLQRLLAAGMPASRVGEAAIWLHNPVPVARIPGFSDGDVSVQDAGAQLAAQWLDVHDGMRVLDACAAPGGKTGHLAEIATLELSALEVDAERARRIDQNLARTGAAATVRVADARAPQSWWDHRPFDRILLDAPCTASGIVGRHPDIPWLRRKADVAHLATLQADLLEALWPLVGVGGRLLYVVCSVFPQEGSEQIARFVERHPDAAVELLPGGTPAVQLLPTTEAVEPWNPTLAWPTRHDGFFYARLEKLR
jgi:16S rRNA (cytosine967-C5)-methyltransferase